MKIELGMEVVDKLSGMEGTVIALYTGLYDADEALVANNKYPNGKWIHVERLGWCLNSEQ